MNVFELCDTAITINAWHDTWIDLTCFLTVFHFLQLNTNFKSFLFIIIKKKKHWSSFFVVLFDGPYNKKDTQNGKWPFMFKTDMTDSNYFYTLIHWVLTRFFSSFFYKKKDCISWNLIRHRDGSSNWLIYPEIFVLLV